MTLKSVSIRTISAAVVLAGMLGVCGTTWAADKPKPAPKAAPAAKPSTPSKPAGGGSTGGAKTTTTTGGAKTTTTTGGAKTTTTTGGAKTTTNTTGGAKTTTTTAGGAKTTTTGGKAGGTEGKPGGGNTANKSAIKTPAPKGTTEHVTKTGSAVRTRPNGKVSDVHDAKRNMDIHHGLDGSRKVSVTRKDGSRVVVARGRAGYVERGYRYGGHDFARRSYYYHGAYYNRYYRGYYYGGVYMNVYAPAYYYGPAYYGWAYNPWPAPVAYGWGWGGNPWYGYYGGYFAPYPVYPSAAFWLADYLIAANLEAAYAARAAAEVAVAPSESWTDAHLQVAEGKSYTITAAGAIQFNTDLSSLAAPDGRNDIDGGVCHHGQIHDGYPAPELPCLSLIGKIGRNGVPFEVGHARTLIASTSGELYLGVNDTYLADNSGGWIAHVSGAGADKAAAAVALSPATKQLVSDEVKSVLALENAESQQTQQKQDVDPASSGITRLIQDVKAGHSHVFVVGDSVDVTDASGTECPISDGDVLQMTTAPADGATSADVVLLASKGGKECAASATVSVEVSDLQEMQNHLRETVDQGLEELQKKQGKGGLPAAPPSAQGKPTPTDFAAAAPAEDPKDKADIEAQAKEADKAETEVVAEAGTGQPGASPVGAVTPAGPPPEIALGQTEDQVKAILGNPTKTAVVGTKQIYYYDGMKVVFKDGKVSDVQ